MSNQRKDYRRHYLDIAAGRKKQDFTDYYQLITGWPSYSEDRDHKPQGYKHNGGKCNGLSIV